MESSAPCPTTLRVLTWNISFGYGLGSDGTASFGEPYRHKSRQHFEFVLNSMGDYLHRLNIDIAFLQETDFNSSRSYHWNQANWISRRANLLHRESVVSWDHPYVPYPGIHPKNHFRSVCSGGAVLSRFPLRPLSIDLLAKPREKGRAYNHFAPARYLQCVEVVLTPSESLRVLNCHLEAFSESNRELHWLRLSERLPDFDIDLVGGDFNGPPALTASALQSWNAVEVLQKTFPSHRPDRTLDGFVLKKSHRGKTQVLDSGALSDHRPVLLELDWAGKN